MTMCPYEYYQNMKNCKDKKQFRYQMVVYTQGKGIKPAARDFNTTPDTVRKWKTRFEEKGYNGLEDQSRRPHNSPNAIPEPLKDHIAALKDKYKRIGADQIKILEEVACSPRTMRKIWRERGKSSRRRRPKYETKRNLREVKKKLKLFEMVCEDTKELKDIPEYFPLIRRNKLPGFQYTFRDVTTGMLYMGFANEKSLAHSTIFAKYIQSNLQSLNIDLSNTLRQTDNGSEYIGAWNAKESSAYTKTVESIPGQRHQTIPVRKYRWQADVETVHDIVEREFYEIEAPTSRQDFMDKAYTYQLFFNLERPNTYKENKTPWQLAQEKLPDIKKDVAMIPAVDLDVLLYGHINFLYGQVGTKKNENPPSSPFCKGGNRGIRNYSQVKYPFDFFQDGVYDVPSSPFYKPKIICYNFGYEF